MNNIFQAKTLCLFLFLLMSNVIIAQTNNKEIFYQYKKEKGVFGITIPGFVIRNSLRISGDLSKEDNQLMKTIKNVRVLAEHDNVSFEKRFLQHIDQLLADKVYHNFATITDEDAVIEIVARPIEKKNKNVQHFIVLGDDAEEQELVAIFITGDFSQKQLKAISKAVRQ